jgi:hypothetical protein
MVDLDGSIDAAPGEFGPLMRALRAAGHTVSIVTGVKHNMESDPKDAYAAKVKQLDALDCGDCWDDMTVIAITDPKELAKAKAEWCHQNGISCAIDNNKTNAKAMVADAGIPLVLVPWATRTDS